MRLARNEIELRLEHGRQSAQQSDRNAEIIDNWVRWARGRTISQRRRVASLEGRYSTLDWGEDVVEPEPVKSLSSPINQLLAEQTEQAWRALPDKMQVIIKAHYFQRKYYKLTCRVIKIPFREYPELLADSTDALIFRLTVSTNAV